MSDRLEERWDECVSVFLSQKIIRPSSWYVNRFTHCFLPCRIACIVQGARKGERKKLPIVFLSQFISQTDAMKSNFGKWRETLTKNKQEEAMKSLDFWREGLCRLLANRPHYFRFDSISPTISFCNHNSHHTAFICSLKEHSNLQETFSPFFLKRYRPCWPEKEHTLTAHWRHDHPSHLHKCVCHIARRQMWSVPLSKFKKRKI